MQMTTVNGSTHLPPASYPVDGAQNLVEASCSMLAAQMETTSELQRIAASGVARMRL